MKPIVMLYASVGALCLSLIFLGFIADHMAGKANGYRAQIDQICATHEQLSKEMGAVPVGTLIACTDGPGYKKVLVMQIGSGQTPSDFFYTPAYVIEEGGGRKTAFDLSEFKKVSPISPNSK